jgi:valyl-tRNA synthetase
MDKKEIPKSYNPTEHEDKIYQRWEKSGYFNPDKCIADDITDKNADAYTISMPPPNRTGVLHMGHAVMLVIQDILTRYHRMKGEKALWLPGSDHAAIATQTKVEKIIKEEGTNRHEMGREKFLARVVQFAQESHETIVSQVKKMGSSCDWSREAYTFDETRNKAVRSVFKLMYDDGLIYRGDRVVNWCPRCHSTLADDEVEYEAQKAKLYTFKYDKDFPFAIATTRPETKLGDTAVAVNPNDKRYKKYIGQTFKVNFVGVDLEIKIIADKEVEADFGTGALGVTPAHSMVDWQMAQENDLPVIKVIDEDGNIHQGFGEYSGKTVLEAREMIVRKLKADGLLEKEEEMDNNLSLCYRCGTPIEPLPSLQWFIDVNKKLKVKNKNGKINWDGKSIKDVALEVIKTKQIKIVPDRFEKIYFNWMNNLRDWCISRQIWFGHQIPVYYCKQGISNFQFPPASTSEAGRAISNGGVALRQIKKECSKPIVSIEKVDRCPHCGGEVEQDPGTLDTWFSSGLWTFSTLANSPDQIKIKDGKIFIDNDDFKNYHPTSVLETGYDIIFFWVARMIIMTTYAVGDIPFQDVYLHGLVRDEKGRKMSKSLGNALDPIDSCEKYGTDATRLSLIIGTTPGNDMNLSEEKIAGLRNFTNKLWNISRYIITKCHPRSIVLNRLKPDIYFSPQLLQNNSITVADKWIIDKLNNLIKEVSDDLENYRFSAAAEKLRAFTWDDLADWYLEVSKFEDGKSDVLNYILINLLKLWHPFIPFVTEKIWQEVFGEDKMLMIEKWPQSKKQIKTNQQFDLIIEIIKAIRNARSQYKIAPNKKIKAVIYAGKYAELIESQKELIKKLRTGVNELEIKDKGTKMKNAIYATVNGLEIYLLVPDFDFQAEADRLKKEISNLEKLVAGQKEKLSNKEFIGKAPEKIVNQEKEKLISWQENLNKLKEQSKNIK